MTAVAAYAAQLYAELSMGSRPRLSAAAATPLYKEAGVSGVFSSEKHQTWLRRSLQNPRHKVGPTTIW